MLSDPTHLRPKVQAEPVHRPVARIELEGGISIGVLEASLPLTIGRSSSCDISIPSGHVSRRHCELYLVNGVLCLKDTSSNGTIVDDRVIRSESISIQGKTTVYFAGEVKLTITPAISTEVVDEIVDIDRRKSYNRRLGDRRQSDSVVSFERRRDRERRTDDRRECHA